jgi:hypothetical protein
VQTSRGADGAPSCRGRDYFDLALSIQAVTGATLIASASHSPVLVQVLPFVCEFTIFWWATATWWIPMLHAPPAGRDAAPVPRLGHRPLRRR